MEKYKILKDYHTEGWHFDEGEFLTVNEAVKAAVEANYGNPFLIVKIINWEAVVVPL